MAEKLTADQVRAVENRGGKLLVSAAAGSGKTKVLVDRMLRYIMDPDDPANVDDFLIITYTKAAAAELRGKIASKLSELIAQSPENRHLQQQMQRIYLANISTVHSFCSDILRQYAYRLDIPADFRVADENENLQLKTKVIEQVLDFAYESIDSNPDFAYFVDTQGLGRDDRQVPDIILKVFDSARCHLDPEGWLDNCVASKQVSECLDVGKTPAGQYLIDDLKRYLKYQIVSFQNCINAALHVEEIEKPVMLFEQTILQLQQLYECDTWDEIIRNKSVDFGRLVFSKKCTDLQLAEQMKAVRNACKEGLAKKLKAFSDESTQIMQDIFRVASAERGLVWLVKEFSSQYLALKKKIGVLDFSDLEHHMLDLLLGKHRNGITRIAVEIGDRFREIMVDEYQDSNGIQDAIFGALTERRQNCFMVGDVKQSIYRFRLADPGIFIDKYNHYRISDEAVSGEGRKVLLSKNFRSSNGVLQCVNDVFLQCMSEEVGDLSYGEDEMLYEGVPHISLDEPEVSLFALNVENDTYKEEASFIADEIRKLLDGKHHVRDGDSLRPIVPEDIVILLRSPGSVGYSYSDALHANGIRCITGDSINLLETEEIATVHALLQVIYNPVQDIPLLAVATSPIFGFTADDLAELRSRDKISDMYHLIASSSDNKCVQFIDSLVQLRESAKILTVTQLLSEIYSKTELLSIYSAMSDGVARLDNLQAFFKIISDYESTGTKDLGRVLEFLSSCSDKGLSSSGAQQESGAVTIMSIHKSKGLEFPVVFLCGLSRSFNKESAYNQVLCDQELGLGLNCVDTSQRLRYPTITKRAISTKILKESISEELRVLYVAMTRARDRLIMTYSVHNLEKVISEISMRIAMSCPELMAMDVDCPGDWILQAALTRTESGEFFALGGNPGSSIVRDTVWKVSVVNGVNIESPVLQERELTPNISQDIVSLLKENLSFSYRWDSATQIPSKLTATQLKGRNIDQEIADGNEQEKILQFRKPGSSKISGKSYGNALHIAMQYIHYDACVSLESIQNDVERMVRENLISPEQAKMIDCKKLHALFSTELGTKIRNGKHVFRELKFSLLDQADKYYSDATNEKILLQGIVDCAIIEDDGIIVLDFKSDYVTEDTVLETADRYRSQVVTYAHALQRIYEVNVKEAYLYFFRLNRFVSVEI